MLLDYLLSLLAPNDCLGCATEGALLCVQCQKALPPAGSRCYRCQRPTADFATCTACQSSSALEQLIAATSYRGTAKMLVQQIKYHSARIAAKDMATCMTERYDIPPDVLLVSVPTASSRVRSRSYDQSELLANRLASLLHVSHVSLLRRLGQAHQVGANRQDRFKHLEGAYRLVKPKLVRGRHILLIDDVSTTGATLEAAAKVMAAAGAAKVSAAVFARA